MLQILSGLRPEAQLLLAVLKNRQGSDPLVPPVASGFDWESFYRIAEQNAVIPLVFRAMSDSVLRDVPPVIAARVRNHANKIRGHNVALTKQLTFLLNLFEQHEIPVIPYKGPVLAEALYGNIGLREFDDLDLLVHKKDILKIKELLISTGYRPKKELEGMTAQQERAFLKLQYSYDFISQNPIHQLEVHWDILARSFSLTVDYEGLWTRAIQGTFAGRTISMLSPEDSLLLACIAGAKKLWRRLSRVCDVAQLVALYPSLNWQQVLRQSKEAGAELILLTGVSLASNLLETPLPLEVESTLKAVLRENPLPERLTAAMFAGNAQDSDSVKDQFQRLHLQMRERFIDRFRYAVRVVFTPGAGEWAVVSLPRGFYFLYYLLRPMRLLGKGVKRYIKRDRLTRSNGSI